MKKLLTISFLSLLSTSCFAHQNNHFAEMFVQFLFPIAILGILVCLPVTFLLAISKFEKKYTRMLYAGYVIAAFLFFGLLKFLYSSIHNHFDLTCQTITFGLSFAFLSLIIYSVKFAIFKLKNK